MLVFLRRAQACAKEMYQGVRMIGWPGTKFSYNGAFVCRPNPIT